MGFFITLAVRLALLVAIWSVWGWQLVGLALLSLILIGIPRTRWGTIDYGSLRIYIRVALEIGILVAGLIAANTAWGAIWAATLTIVYVIDLVAK